ncbi:acetoin utilization AcuB family protein [Bacillus sp. FJAT-47783]|uniref:acetoin utilization AcuB family protein n=1 Tax=Bacillus sp. FJAT-47783 TaxID=2922712 RepID=UPI001FAE5F8F|nr:acetoin utilization AcuB family protein [Bacillus sp. FJAT-47783]
MIIEKIMKKEVITLSPNDTIATAMKLMRKHYIRHIPIVLNDETLVGIVSDRDIREASPSTLLLTQDSQSIFTKPLSDIMTTDVITVHPLDFVEDAATVFFENRISCLPVIQHEKIVGIVTEADVLYKYVQLTGAHQPSSRIEVKVPNRSGMLSEVSALFHEKHVNISSVLVYPIDDDQYKILVFRVQTMNPMSVVNLIKQKGYDVLWPKVPEMEI